MVLNAPARVGRELLRPLPAFADITAVLDEYRYFTSRLLIHTDAAYVHRDRRNWAAYNAGVDGRRCEGSAWLGALQEAPASGAPLHVFKSWAQRRRADPKHILLERRFRHPLISRSTIRAARALGPLQGRRGLYFSGQYTTGMDLQESARLVGHGGGRVAGPRQRDPGVAEGAPERACGHRRHLVRPLTARRVGGRPRGHRVGLHLGHD